MTKLKRIKKWKVRVLGEVDGYADYEVYAVDSMDARILAFALDGGFPRATLKMRSGDIELVKMYTEILGGK